MIISDQVAETCDACDRKEDLRALLFLLYTKEKYMAYKPIKPFLTYENQMDNLEFNKNLIIEDRNYAKEMLQNIRYYSLIDGYKILFYN